jgi:hypothetical protein
VATRRHAVVAMVDIARETREMKRRLLGRSTFRYFD